MYGKHLQTLLLLFLLSPFRPACAQGADGAKSRDALVRESIANLDSSDIRVADRAASYLGMLRAAEGVPAMLRVLQSRRDLRLIEHCLAKDENGLSEWLLTDVKGEIVVALGLIGDRRAVPVLKKYLKRPPVGSEVYPGDVAYALYRLTGKSYKYRDRDGRMRPFRPSGGATAPDN